MGFRAHDSITKVVSVGSWIEVAGAQEKGRVLGKEMKRVQLSPLTWVHFSSSSFLKCQLLLVNLSPKILSEKFQK